MAQCHPAPKRHIDVHSTVRELTLFALVCRRNRAAIAGLAVRRFVKELVETVGILSGYQRNRWLSEFCTVQIASGSFGIEAIHFLSCT